MLTTHRPDAKDGDAHTEATRQETGYLTYEVAREMHFLGG